MNHLVHALPGSCSTFLVPAPKKIGTELKVVHGASTKWCAWYSVTNWGNLRSSLGQKFDPLEYPKIGIFDSSIKAGKMA